jgi:uncharacterized protein YuzE
MKLHYDKTADAIHLRLDDSPIVESQERDPGVVLDYNEKGQVVGVEILGVKARIPEADLTRLTLEVAE